VAVRVFVELADEILGIAIYFVQGVVASEREDWEGRGGRQGDEVDT